MSATIKKIVVNLQTDFFTTMNSLTKKQMEGVMRYLSDEYYNNGRSLISDENYDRLRDLLARKFGDSELLTNVGAEVTKEKVDLPFFLGSMDKIKPDKNNLISWLTKYKGKYCISDKLDGISGLIVKKEGKIALYTRGNGAVGQNISHMIPFIKIGDMPSLETYAVRGELIVSKENYGKVAEGKRGARQMVSGLANQKTLTKERKELMSLIDFVAYEVIVPETLAPSKQFKLLDSKSTFNVARWELVDNINIESLSELLTKRKHTSKYEIDGIIVAHDAIYPRTKGGNPEYAFAFKMSFAEQQATTEVLQVNWEASKDGYLKPTVNFEPVNIGGVIIQYATGFNAAFIHEHGIGPGAFIDIIRSGDVIPYIKEVKSIAPGGPSMPTQKWHWNDTHIDAVLDDIDENPDVQKRALLYFAQTLEIGFCGEGNITKIHDMGIHTIPDFIKLTEKQLIEGGGFGKVSAGKLVEEIHKAVKKATVVQWAVGSGIFGRGIGTKRTDLAFGVVPPTLVSPKDLTERITKIPGWSKESAEGFVANLPTFRKFMSSIGWDFKAKHSDDLPKPVVNGKLTGQVILFTGFHPKDLEADVVKHGGTIADSWTKKVTILVVKDSSVINEKTKKAAVAGIPVMDVERFSKMI